MSVASKKLNHLSATQIAQLVQKRELTAEDVIRDCIDQVERIDTELQAWVHFDPENALKQAKMIDQTAVAGRNAGRLCGVPVGVKDIFNTVDMPTQMGSPIWKGFTPGNDARVVFSTRMAGAVIPGKTTTAEFAVHSPAPTRNPHNPRYMPGTSSSGSAVAVAAYMVPLALGTQTAGSILRPASYCGVYGMKPSFGLLPRTGMLKTTDSLDTVGFFARTVDDLDVMLDVTRVHGLDYPISHAALSDTARQQRGNRPWRIAFVRGTKWNDAEAYAREAIEEYAGRVARDQDVEVEEVTLSPAFDRAHEIHAIIYDRTLAYYFKEEFKEHTLISPIMYEIITRGNAISLQEYQAALRDQAALAAEFDQLMTRYDAVLTLTTGGAPFEGLDKVDRPDSCLVWTLCGAPAVNIPAFRSTEGLPFGAQLVGRKYNDLLLLRLLADLRDRGHAPNETQPRPSAPVIEE